MADPIAASLVAVIEGATAGRVFIALRVALAQLGSRNDEIVKYGTATNADGILMIVHGTAEDAEPAHSILANLKANVRGKSEETDCNLQT